MQPFWVDGGYFGFVGLVPSCLMSAGSGAGYWHSMFPMSGKLDIQLHCIMVEHYCIRAALIDLMACCT